MENGHKIKEIEILNKLSEKAIEHEFFDYSVSIHSSKSFSKISIYNNETNKKTMIFDIHQDEDTDLTVIYNGENIWSSPYTNESFHKAFLYLFSTEVNKIIDGVHETTDILFVTGMGIYNPRALKKLEIYK